MLLRPVVLAVCLFSATCAHADKIDDLVNAQMKAQHIPGLSLAIVKDGKIVREQGFGLANVEHQVAVKPDTIFQSGSIGKQFTASLVMLLVQDGKLGLDDPIARHLTGTPPAWGKITIRQLLTHTSGLADPYEKIDFRKDYTDEELIKLESQIPLRFQPGEAFAYSNMGYHLLGFICNKVGGKFYGDQLAERIFKPSGMHTRIISERDIVPNRAAGYDWVKGELKNQEFVSPSLNTTADGSLYLTAHDLARWDLALYGDKPLSTSIKKMMWTPATLNDGKNTDYGFGWRLTQTNGHTTIEHGGSWQGFRSQISRYVDDKLAVVVLANVSSANTEKIAHLIAAEMNPELRVRPAKAIDDVEPAVTEQVRSMLIKAMDGTVTQAIFSEKLAARIFPDGIKAMGEGLRENGALQKLELLARSVDGETRLYHYRAVFANEPVLIDLTFDKAGRISHLSVRPE